MADNNEPKTLLGHVGKVTAQIAVSPVALTAGAISAITGGDFDNTANKVMDVAGYVGKEVGDNPATSQILGAYASKKITKEK